MRIADHRIWLPALAFAALACAPCRRPHAGMMGCGELILELRQRLNQLPPQGIFKLIARDSGVPEDLPAWCRMTGHRLVRAASTQRFINPYPEHERYHQG